MVTMHSKVVQVMCHFLKPKHLIQNYFSKYILYIVCYGDPANMLNGNCLLSDACWTAFSTVNIMSSTVSGRKIQLIVGNENIA